MKRWLATTALLVTSLVFCGVIAEVSSRYILPVSPGMRTIGMDGEAITIEEERLRLPRNLKYREVSQEFDVQVTLTDKGHRVPQVRGNPQIVFLGDSFTFGQGLHDEQTFVAIFCENFGLRCANLGRGGSGTRFQLDILEHFLEHENWRPPQLRLFMLVMTSALMDGNDLSDNLREAQIASLADGKAEGPALLSELLNYRKQLLRHSNLARLMYFYFGPLLRTLLSPAPSRSSLDVALEETARQLQRLRRLAQRYGFEYRIYLLYPMQDILGGTHQQTLATLRRIAPSDGIVDTARVLLDDASKYYYPYDGHLNPQGARRIAELLMEEHERAESAPLFATPRPP